MLLRSVCLLTLLAVGAWLGGCSIPFYWQAASGQLSLMRKRVPIESVLEDPGASVELKAMLSGIDEVRSFAVENLDLPVSDSYTTYADLERDFVVWNVVATPEFSVAPETWCFPFTGCVSYRGYFDRDNAERFRAGLVEDGFDTYLGGARAYSTLGFFDDPVLNTMIAGGPTYIASLLFHEMAHQKLYIKDDSELSEAFASVIEEYGTRMWLAAHATEEQARSYEDWLSRRRDFAALVRRQRERLREVFARDVSDSRMREDKQAAYELMREEYAELKRSWGGASDYDAWFAQPLNNAALASVATYRYWQPVLYRHLEAVGLTAFYEDMAELAELSGEMRRERLAQWEARQAARSRSVRPPGQPSGQPEVLLRNRAARVGLVSTPM